MSAGAGQVETCATCGISQTHAQRVFKHSVRISNAKNLEKYTQFVELEFFISHGVYPREDREGNTSELLCTVEKQRGRRAIASQDFYIEYESYLGAAAVQALNVGTRLSEIVSVVEDLFVAAAGLVLHIIQRTDLALGFDVYFLHRNLERETIGCISHRPAKSCLISEQREMEVRSRKEKRISRSFLMHSRVGDDIKRKKFIVYIAQCVTRSLMKLRTARWRAIKTRSNDCPCDVWSL